MACNETLDKSCGVVNSPRARSQRSALSGEIRARRASADPSSGAGSPAPADNQAILQPAVADVTAQLGKPAELDAVGLHSANGWAFVWAKIEEPNGSPTTTAELLWAEAAAKAERLEDTNGLAGSRRRQIKDLAVRVAVGDALRAVRVAVVVRVDQFDPRADAVAKPVD